MSLDAQISVEVVAIAMFLCFLAVSFGKGWKEKAFFFIELDFYSQYHSFTCHHMFKHH